MNNYWVETTAEDLQGAKEIFSKEERELIFKELSKMDLDYLYDILLNHISIVKANKIVCIIKKGKDEWYFINLFIDDPVQWRRYLKCDQLDGLLFFINSIYKIKKSFENTDEKYVSNYQDFLKSK